MYRISVAIVCLLSTIALAAPKSAEPAADGAYPFQFRNADVVDVVQAYTKITGQKFVIDASIKGKITIINPQKVSAEEAFNLLSLGLSTNGLAISEQGDTMVLLQARSTQRNLIPVVTELPAMKPEKMISWVAELKHVDADEINKQLRLITSNQGEVFPFGKNKLIVTDWISNLYRVRDLLAQVDQPGYQPAVRHEVKTVNPEK